MRSGRCIVSGLEADSHTWNLVFIQLLLQECDFEVLNLGPCVPALLLAETIAVWEPDLVVISTVNGCCGVQGKGLISALAAQLERPLPPMIIGGILTTSTGGEQAARLELLRAGYRGVFVGEDSKVEFVQFLNDWKRQHRVSKPLGNLERFPPQLVRPEL